MAAGWAGRAALPKPVLAARVGRGLSNDDGRHPPLLGPRARHQPLLRQGPAVGLRARGRRALGASGGDGATPSSWRLEQQAEAGGAADPVPSEAGPAHSSKDNNSGVGSSSSSSEAQSPTGSSGGRLQERGSSSSSLLGGAADATRHAAAAPAAAQRGPGPTPSPHKATEQQQAAAAPRRRGALYLTVSARGCLPACQGRRAAACETVLALLCIIGAHVLV